MGLPKSLHLLGHSKIKMHSYELLTIKNDFPFLVRIYGNLLYVMYL